MKLRNRPTAPKRKKDIRYALPAYGLSLADCEREMETHLYNAGYSTGEIREYASMEHIQITSEYEPYDDTPTPYIRVRMPESDKSVAARSEKYRKRLRDYNRWYNENEAEIKAELQKRKEAKNAEEAEKIHKQMEKLEKRLEKVKS